MVSVLIAAHSLLYKSLRRALILIVFLWGVSLLVFPVEFG